MVRTIMPHLRYSNIWEKPPESEIERLQKKLYIYIKKIKIPEKINKEERINFVSELLNKQNHTCAFGKNNDGKYCWNKPKDSNKKYLHLHFGHILSTTSEDKPCRLKYFYLLCTRCNKQLQTSRNLFQLKDELESKIKNINEFIKKL